MKRNITFLLLTLIIAAGALVQDFRFDRQSADARARLLAAERGHAALAVTLANVRAAQAAYVATGQDAAFWMTHGTDLVAKASAALTHLRGQAAAPATAARLEAADVAFAEFNQHDGRARDFVRSDQKLFASDLVFMDALDAMSKVEAELAAARDAESAEAEEALIEVARLRLAMNTAAFGGLALLVFLVRPPARVAEPKQAPSTLQMIRDLPPPVKKAPPPQPPVATPAAPAVPPVLKPANLSAAAELCVDVARVADGRDMPGLVERVAAVLEAKGVVLWVVDAAGAQLRPAVTHGYTDKVVARLGPLQIDGENVTALAFRSMQPQTVTGTSPADAGAVAVPLITSSGCVGVLAAETRPNRSGHDVLPLARILAAQFASVVSPADSGIEARTVQA
jgi:hypothetical protein